MNQNSVFSLHQEMIYVRVLMPEDAAAYRAVRLLALEELPAAFGSLPEDEPGLSQIAARLMAKEQECFYGAFEGDQLMGSVRISRYPARNEQHRAYLGGLYLLPAHRGKGYGKRLVGHALQWAIRAGGIRRVNLSVVSGQTAAIGLYQSLGFRIYGTELEAFWKVDRYYDEHLMTIELAPGNEFNGIAIQ